MEGHGSGLVPNYDAGSGEGVTQEKRQASKRSESCGEPWKAAVKRLYRTVISVSNSKTGFSSPEETLNSLLDEVERDEMLTQTALVQKLRNRANDDGDVVAGSEEPNETRSPLSEGAVAEQLPNDADVVTCEDDLIDDTGDGEQRELFERLVKASEVLTDGGSTGLKRLDEFLFKTSTSKYHSAVEFVTVKLQDQWNYILNLILPRQQLQTLVFVGLVHVVSVERVFGFLPLLICYASFLLMIHSTLAMFGCRKWLRQAENWRRLLTLFRRATDDHDDTLGDRESFYSLKSTEPYITYFISLILFTFSLGLTSDNDKGVTTLPNGWSMCAIGAFFALVCFLALADRYDGWSVSVMALDLLASAPAILGKFGMQIRIPGIASIFSNWTVHQLGLIKVQLGLPSLSLLAVLVVYCIMIATYSRREIYTVVVPHFVCVAWWHASLQLFLVSASSSLFSSIGWYDVALSLCVIWLVVFPTVAALVVVGAVIVAQMRTVFDSVSVAKAGLAATVLILPILYWKLRQLAEQRSRSVANSAIGKGHLKTTVLALLAYGLVVFASVSFLYGQDITAVDGLEARRSKTLTWTQYERHCSYGDENLGNRLRQQISCSQLGGVTVNWKGTVQGVRIAKIENIFENILSYLPQLVASRLRCLYGERANDTADAGSVTQGLVLDECTLANRNVYTFEIDAAGPWGQHTFSSAKGSVVLVASANFQELATEFEQGDVIDFTASFLTDSLLKYPPKLKLSQLQCLACQHVSNDKHTKRYFASYGSSLWSKLFTACRFVFNFIFSPLLVIG